ncbi:MAG TPA: protein kinase [Bdellovibrionota bacterium]|jgi:serine/threonine-protein kinase|nr:protein kinase [Bdellovibrionota bacterium]
MALFAGTFIPLEKIAEGGMAEIFLARQTGAGKFSKVVVLKKVFPKFADNPEFRDMFQAEAALCSLMHHPNIVNVYSSGFSDKHLYMSMEYISGLSLKDLIKRTTSDGKRIATPMLLHIAHQVASGLDYIHKLHDPQTQAHLGLIHRDVSPQNVMISYRGEIKLIDFGIAKASSTLTNETQNGVIKGNFAYMSPQQARAEALTPLTDIYSLGVVLFEAITGRRPFQGDNPIELLKAIDRGAYEKPSKTVPSLDPFLENLVVRMMSADPTHRPAASVLCDLLQRELSSKYPKFNATEFAKAMSGSFKREHDQDQERIANLLKQSAEQAERASAQNVKGSSDERTQVSRLVPLQDVKPIVEATIRPPLPRTQTNASTISNRSTLSELASTVHWKNDSQIIEERKADLRRYERRVEQMKWVKRLALLALVYGALYAAHTYLPDETQNEIAKHFQALRQKAERSIASLRE